MLFAKTFLMALLAGFLFQNTPQGGIVMEQVLRLTVGVHRFSPDSRRRLLEESPSKTQDSDPHNPTGIAKCEVPSEPMETYPLTGMDKSAVTPKSTSALLVILTRPINSVTAFMSFYLLNLHTADNVGAKFALSVVSALLYYRKIYYAQMAESLAKGPQDYLSNDFGGKYTKTFIPQRLSTEAVSVYRAKPFIDTIVSVSNTGVLNRGILKNTANYVNTSQNILLEATNSFEVNETDSINSTRDDMEDLQVNYPFVKNLNLNFYSQVTDAATGRQVTDAATGRHLRGGFYNGFPTYQYGEFTELLAAILLSCLYVVYMMVVVETLRSPKQESLVDFVRRRPTNPEWLEAVLNEGRDQKGEKEEEESKDVLGICLKNINDDVEEMKDLFLCIDTNGMELMNIDISFYSFI